MTKSRVWMLLLIGGTVLGLAGAFRAVMVQDPAGVLLERGDRLFEAGKVPEALAAFDEAVRLDPKSPFARRVRATALMQLNRHREAMADWDRVIASQRPSSVAHYYRGVAALNLGLLDVAMSDLHRAADLLPDPDAHVIAALAEAEAAVGHFDEAVRQIDQALELAKSDSEFANRDETVREWQLARDRYVRGQAQLD